MEIQLSKELMHIGRTGIAGGSLPLLLPLFFHVGSFSSRDRRTLFFSRSCLWHSRLAVRSPHVIEHPVPDY